MTSTAFTQTVFSYFTTEFTWYYWYYYWTYIAISSNTVVASYQVTSVTTVSVKATDSAEAAALFNSLSATFMFPTPTQTTTTLQGSSPSLTMPKPTATTSGSITPPPFTGAAAPLRPGMTTSWIGCEWALGVLALLPGLLAMWL
jgi:hypothetical protein